MGNFDVLRIRPVQLEQVSCLSLAYYFIRLKIQIFDNNSLCFLFHIPKQAAVILSDGSLIQQLTIL